MPPSAPRPRRRKIVPPITRLRNQESQTTNRRAPSPEQTWPRHILGGLSSFLLLFGVLLYGCLSTVYISFYSPLGVGLGDVGLNYGTVLSRASNYVYFLLAIFFTFALLPPLITLLMEAARPHFTRPLSWRSIRQGGRAISRLGTLPMNEFMRALWQGTSIAGATSMACLLLLIGTIHSVTNGDAAAAAVRTGRPIISKGYMLGPPMVPIRADPVSVSTAGKPNDIPVVDDLSKRTNLLYLGQADGTVVLYDPNQPHVIYLPANTSILNVSVCRTRRSNARCSNAIEF